MSDSPPLPDKVATTRRKRVFKTAFLLFESRPFAAIPSPPLQGDRRDKESREEEEGGEGRKEAIAAIDTQVMLASTTEKPVVDVDVSDAKTVKHRTIPLAQDVAAEEQIDVADAKTVKHPTVPLTQDVAAEEQIDVSDAETHVQAAVMAIDISTVETTKPPRVTVALPESEALSTPEPPLKPPMPAPEPPLKPQKTARQRQTTRLKIVNVLLLFCLLMPIFAILAEGINAYIMYNYAHDGVQHLLHVKALFTGLKAHPTGLLDVNTLHIVQDDFRAARADFQQLKNGLEQDPLLSLSTGLLPRQIMAAHALSQIGIDVSDIGQQSMQLVTTLSPSMQGALLPNAKGPLVTPATMTLVRTTIAYILPRLNDMQLQARGLSFDVLPISAEQKSQAMQVIQALPQVQNDLVQALGLLDATAWILGVNQPRTLLVQTMDRAELRPTGGFTGQFGELQINAGRVAPFTLRNIGPLEENNPKSLTNGQLAPTVYRSWWPVPNWGLRDSNLSADFPTSARIAIDAYKYEFHHQVDGVLLFSPFLIARVLQVTGPIAIPAYHELITGQNLEERLHYYQLDNVAIRKEEIIEHVEDPVMARKLFTADLARLLVDHVRHASPTELIAIGDTMLSALHTKDLQVYVNNPQIEALLVKYHAAAQMDRSNAHDSLYVVQANVSASKASQYVHTVFHDVVTLDAKGGATHVMQIRLVYNQIGPVYGLDTYRDYMRIYVPKSSTLLWGDGFDSGVPLCGGPYGSCPQNDIYQNGALLCEPGGYEAGAATGMLNDPYTGRYHPLDKIGPPTNTTSDEPERAMFGGWVVIPKNCTMTVTLSWYVPPLGQLPYSLLIQRQSSTFPELDLTILPTPGACNELNIAGSHITTVLDGEDLLISAKPALLRQRTSSCYPAPKI